MKRYVLEGEWSGYTSSQQRIVHREVITSRYPMLLAWLQETHGISYTDGTMLYLTVRDAKPRERVIEQLGYQSLIRDCFFYRVSSVAELVPAKEAYRAEAQANMEKST